MSDDVATTRRHGRRRSPTSDRPHGGSRFRADVEGLRAIAVGLVLLYHAGLTDLSGGFVGVDVFFVISGFLITGLLLSEFDRSGTVSLVTFYARRAKRLLPAACIVLVVTAVLSRIVLPEYRWEVTGKDILSAAFYFVNWRLADRSVDYLAEDVAPSPVQHFWSLAVEEQFYIVWPLLLVVVGLLARRFGHGRRLLTFGLVAIAVISFAYSLSETDANPARAFFVTPTRMWELAVGGLVAVAVTVLPRIPRPVALVLGWGGLAAIVLAGFVVSETMPWPGWRAALPVLGTAAVIAAGPAAGRAGPAMLLGTRPMCWVGGLSYSLYLWHWPLLVLAEEHYDGLTPAQGLLVVAVSAVPAWITHKLVENPVRHSSVLAARPRLALGVGANVTVAAAISGVALAAVVGGATAGDIRPNPVRAERDVPDLYAKGCQQDQFSAEVVTCTYGPVTAKTTIAVFGDSKIAQWVPALQAMLPTNDLRVVTYTKSACAPADVDTNGNDGLYTSCREWVRNVLARLTGPEKPDFVLTSQRSSAAAGASPEQRRTAMRDALGATWGQLEAAGVRVIVLADTPSPPFTVWQCVARNRSDPSKCEFERDPAVANSAAPLLREAVEQAPTKPAYIDLLADICPAPICPPVIGDVLVYRQGSHLTATFVTELTPALAAALRSAGVPLAADIP